MAADFRQRRWAAPFLTVAPAERRKHLEQAFIVLFVTAHIWLALRMARCFRELLIFP